MADQGHDDNGRNGEEPRRKKAVSVGLAAAYGAAAGTLVFAITGNPFWIAMGPAIGGVIAAVFNEKESE